MNGYNEDIKKDSLLKVFCQFIVETGQQNNLRSGEIAAIATAANTSEENVNENLILQICGYV